VRVNGRGFHALFPPADCSPPQEDWFLWSLPSRWMPSAGSLFQVQIWGQKLQGKTPLISSTSLTPLDAQ
jgi:hypothetical protein